MIELVKSNNGFLKSFNFSLAEKTLRKAVLQKERNQTYWELPEDSEYKLNKDGILIKKPKPRKESEDKSE